MSNPDITNSINLLTKAIRGGYRVSGAVPATAAAAGTAGEIAYDTSFLYICVATNTWMKVAIATW